MVEFCLKSLLLKKSSFFVQKEWFDYSKFQSKTYDVARKV